MHTPNPWPDCSTHKLSWWLGDIKENWIIQSSGILKLYLIRQVLSVNIRPISVKWDMRRPLDVDVHKWRRCQLRRYVDHFPLHKPKMVYDWIKSHNPNPWQQCSTKEISRLLNQIKQSWCYPAEFYPHQLTLKSSATTEAILRKISQYQAKGNSELDVKSRATSLTWM